MQALAERVHADLARRTLTGWEALGFAGLKTVTPSPDELIGRTLQAVGRRGKYLVFDFSETDAPAPRLLIHLSQAGRLDLEQPPKRNRGGKGGVVRLRFGGDEQPEAAVLVREHGTERKAAWWVLAAGDDGPLARLGPEPEDDDFAELILAGADRRRVHTLLRDQATVAGVGRGYADDALWRAQLSPYANLVGLNEGQRQRLLDAVRAVLHDGLDRERLRTGGLSEPKLGGHFEVHGRSGTPCPRCGDPMRRVSYDSYEVTYCPACQTDGKVLADRRLSRLVK
jgi:formamidopyrimidine-DNA glycosylase